MKHKWYLEPNGDIDVWRLEYDIHNGPQCMRCKQSFCEHCRPKIFEDECPSSQLSFFEEDNE